MPTTTAFSYLIMMNIYLREGKVEDALKILEEMLKKRQFIPERQIPALFVLELAIYESSLPNKEDLKERFVAFSKMNQQIMDEFYTAK